MSFFGNLISGFGKVFGLGGAPSVGGTVGNVLGTMGRAGLEGLASGASAGISNRIGYAIGGAPNLYAPGGAEAYRTSGQGLMNLHAGREYASSMAESQARQFDQNSAANPSAQPLGRESAG